MFSRFGNGNGLGSSLRRIPATGGAASLLIAQSSTMTDAKVHPGIWRDDPGAEAYLAGAAQTGDALVAWVS